MTEEEGPSGVPGSAPPFDPAAVAGSSIREHWDDLVGDVEATAAELRDDGWSVLELHPGDVTAVSGEQWGFDVLVPDDEFDRLAAWVDEGSFDDHDVYRAEAGLVFLLVVLKDAERERAVCCPLYYGREAVDGLRELAGREGLIYTHVRRLSEEYVHFTHEDPELFFPDDASAE